MFLFKNWMVLDSKQIWLNGRAGWSLSLIKAKLLTDFDAKL